MIGFRVGLWIFVQEKTACRKKHVTIDYEIDLKSMACSNCETEAEAVEKESETASAGERGQPAMPPPPDRIARHSHSPSPIPLPLSLNSSLRVPVGEFVG